MYIDPKSLQLVTYNELQYLRDSTGTWYFFSNWDWILLGTPGLIEALEEAYQQCLKQ